MDVNPSHFVSQRKADAFRSKALQTSGKRHSLFQVRLITQLASCMAFRIASILVVSPHLLSLQKIEQGGGHLLARIFFSRTNQFQ